MITGRIPKQMFISQEDKDHWTSNEEMEGKYVTVRGHLD